MRALLRGDRVVIVPDAGVEEETVALRFASWEGHAFRAVRSGGGLVLHDLGPHDEAFLVPINVTSMHPDPAIQLISNFAETPFHLEGESYASVEGFWQSLKTPHPDDRRQIAALAGAAARRAGRGLPAPTMVSFRGRSIVWGGPETWDLMRLACRAKFMQSREAREALLSTRPRPLEHRTRRDSRSIPSVIMAGIWTQLRDEVALLEHRDR